MHCKSYSHFFSKKFQHICVSLDVNFNESLTNNIVSFEQLGPEFHYIAFNIWTISQKNLSRKNKDKQDQATHLYRLPVLCTSVSSQLVYTVLFLCALTLKASITTAEDWIELSARQILYTKCQALFSLEKINNKETSSPIPFPPTPPHPPPPPTHTQRKKKQWKNTECQLQILLSALGVKHHCLVFQLKYCVWTVKVPQRLCLCVGWSKSSSYIASDKFPSDTTHI